jgi:hypothetical protein
MPTYTYDHDQSADADVVKFYLRQTGTTAATRDLSDEEIVASLARSALSGRAAVYDAAIECLNSVMIGHGLVGGGIEKEKVSQYEVVYGGRSTKAEVLFNLMKELKRQRARYSVNKPRAVQFVNVTGYDGYN